MDLTFIEEWDEDTYIEWRRDGRRRLNVIIRKFNDWQRDVGMECADEKTPRLLMILIIEAKQTWARRDGGWEWVKVLDQMFEVCKQAQRR